MLNVVIVGLVVEGDVFLVEVLVVCVSVDFVCELGVCE